MRMRKKSGPSSNTDTSQVRNHQATQTSIKNFAKLKVPFHADARRSILASK